MASDSRGKNAVNGVAKDAGLGISLSFNDVGITSGMREPITIVSSQSVVCSCSLDSRSLCSVLIGSVCFDTVHRVSVCGDSGYTG